MKSLFLILMMIPLISFSQFCGTEPSHSFLQRVTENRDQFDQLVQQRKTQRTSAVTYIPVTTHLVADNSGNGRISEARVLDLICRANEDYLDQEIQFYIKNGFKYIDNSILYNSMTSSGQFDNLISFNRVNNTVNIFFCGLAGEGQTFGESGTLGYYSPWQDILVIKNATTHYGSSTLTHEGGHFFSLAHPFIGWENIDYNSSLPTPTTVSWAGITFNVENQSGNNCQSAADGICDTYPNYYSVNTVNSAVNNCVYTDNGKDPTGASITPNVDNFMSYFPDACQSAFTQGQKDAILSDVMSRGWLNNTPPNQTQISSLATTTYPGNGAAIPVQNFDLQWNPVNDALGYYVEVIRTFNGANLNTIASGYTTSTSFSISASDLQNGLTYRWYVRPHSYVSSCSPTIVYDEFVVDASVNVNQLLTTESIRLYPNPVNTGSVTLEVNAKDDVDAEVSVYALNGQLVLETQSISLAAGTNRHDLSVASLNAGIYMVAIATTEGVNHKKLVITK